MGDLLPEAKIHITEELVDGESWLEVRPSLIGGAGQGLFTTRAIEAGTGVCRYLGTPRTLLQMLRSRDRHYVYRLGWNSYVDAQPHPRVLARFVNHHFDPECRNLVFEHRGGDVWYVASRDIQAEEELYADYGSFYWQAVARMGVLPH